MKGLGFGLQLITRIGVVGYDLGSGFARFGVGVGLGLGLVWLRLGLEWRRGWFSPSCKDVFLS